MQRSLFALGLIGLVACGEQELADTDGDGINDLKEESLGLDPNNPDTDGDGLTDAEEVRETETDPLEADTDDDGLEDGEELDLGTDPLDPHSDSDGIEDGVEVDEGSDPLDKNSFPGDGIWPDRASKVEEDGTRWKRGEQIPNFEAVDQYGNEFEMNQLYGYVILLDMSAGWCGPCQQAAQGAEEMYQDLKDHGFLVVHAMVDDYSYTGKVEDDGFTADWADAFGLTFPVLSGREVEGAANSQYADGLTGGSIPFMMLLNRKLEVEKTYTGFSPSQEEAIRALAETLLGVEPEE